MDVRVCPGLETFFIAVLHWLIVEGHELGNTPLLTQHFQTGHLQMGFLNQAPSLTVEQPMKIQFDNSSFQRQPYLQYI